MRRVLAHVFQFFFAVLLGLTLLFLYLLEQSEKEGE